MSRGSSLVGRSLKEVSFRGRYDAAVLAIHRSGERVTGKLGTVELHAGDVLLLQTDDRFAERWRDRGEFAVVVPLDEELRGPSPRRPLVLAVVLAMVVVAATGWVPIVTAVLGACAALVATRTVSFFEAKAAIDLDVMLVIAGAIGLGAAVESSGLAGVVAGGVASVAETFGAFGALAAVLLGTLLLTEMVTNAAAAALMVPIALDVAGRVGGDPRGYAVAVALAASSSSGRALRPGRSGMSRTRCVAPATATRAIGAPSRAGRATGTGRPGSTAAIRSTAATSISTTPGSSAAFETLSTHCEPSSAEMAKFWSRSLTSARAVPITPNVVPATSRASSRVRAGGSAARTWLGSGSGSGRIGSS